MIGFFCLSKCALPAHFDLYCIFMYFFVVEILDIFFVVSGIKGEVIFVVVIIVRPAVHQTGHVVEALQPSATSNCEIKLMSATRVGSILFSFILHQFWEL
jgi:hypothetical protein